MTKYIIIKTQAYNNHALAFSFPDKRLFDDKDEALAYVTNTLIPDEIEFRKSLEDEQYVEDRPEYKQTKYFYEVGEYRLDVYEGYTREEAKLLSRYTWEVYKIEV